MTPPGHVELLVQLVSQLDQAALRLFLNSLGHLYAADGRRNAALDFYLLASKIPFERDS